MIFQTDKLCLVLKREEISSMVHHKKSWSVSFRMKNKDGFRVHFRDEEEFRAFYINDDTTEYQAMNIIAHYNKG